MTAETPVGAPARPGWSTTGLLGVLVLLAALAALTSLVLQPFQGADENQHVAYALAVSHGHLPTLDTLIRPELPGQRHGYVYTANHPPLFYLLQAVPLRLGISLGGPLVGFHLGRLLDVLLALGGLVALACLLRLLAPRRPDLWVAGTALVAFLPISVLISGQIYNDTLAVVTSTLTLLAACTVLLRGPTWRRLAILAGCGLLATASRATGAEVAGLGAVAAAVAVVLHRPTGQARAGVGTLAKALRAGLFVAVVPAAGIGWFFLRNHHLYGDFTGASIIVKRFPSPAVPVSRTFDSGHFWLHQFKNLFGRPSLLVGVPWQLAVIVGVLLAIAAIAGIIRGLHAALTRRLSGPATTVALLLGVHILACAATLLVYVSHGGAAFVRYLLPAIPAIAVLMVYGLGRLGRRSWILAGFVSVVAALTSVTTLMMVARELHSHELPLGGTGSLGWLAAGLRGTGVAGPFVVLWLFLAVAAAAGISMVVSLFQLRRSAGTAG